MSDDDAEEDDEVFPDPFWSSGVRRVGERSLGRVLPIGGTEDPCLNPNGTCNEEMLDDGFGPVASSSDKFLGDSCLGVAAAAPSFSFAA